MATNTTIGTAGRLITADEAADRLGISGRFVRLLADRGELPVIRLGKKCVRFDRDDVEAMIENSKARGPRVNRSIT